MASSIFRFVQRRCSSLSRGSATATPAAIPETDAEWRSKLTEAQYRVTRQGGTEPQFSSKWNNVKGSGTFTCIGCGEALFRADTKFNSGTGWPSFYEAEKSSVEERRDASHGMVRTEVVCATCKNHLGHMFEDGPADKTGIRYCINGIALDYKKD